MVLGACTAGDHQAADVELLQARGDALVLGRVGDLLDRHAGVPGLRAGQRCVDLLQAGRVQVHQAVHVHQVVQPCVAVGDDEGLEAQRGGHAGRAFDHAVQSPAVPAGGDDPDVLDQSHARHSTAAPGLRQAKALGPRAGSYIGRPRTAVGLEEEKKRFLRPMRARGRAGYIGSMTMRRKQMNVTMVERNCADCLLRMLAGRCYETQARVQDLDPENAAERQLEELERSFGPDWKW
jgi:hypothetical protein